MKISRYFDSAVLKPEMTEDEVKQAILECIACDSRTVCVRPCDIDLALQLTKGTDTEVSCVLDFPHGDSTAEGKAALAELYANKGVVEIDMVMNYGYARSGKWDEVKAGIENVVKAAKKNGVGVKVIMETCQLSEEQIKKATKVAIEAGADFVKTSTGFSKSGASVEAVEAMLSAAEGKIKVKASGGIRNYETAKMYMDMGVDRLGIGFGSAVKITEGEKLSR